MSISASKVIKKISKVPGFGSTAQLKTYFKNLVQTIKQGDYQGVERFFKIPAQAQKMLLSLKHTDEAVKAEQSLLHTAIFLAPDTARDRIVIFFIEKIIELDLKAMLEERNVRGHTPLHFAACWGYLEILKKLIAAGADINAKFKPVYADDRESEGSTPLMIASLYNNSAVLRQLCTEKNIELEAQDALGRTALSFALRKGCEENIKILLDHKALITSITSMGATMLMHAAASGSLTIVRSLLEMKKIKDQINVADKKGCTVLHHVSDQYALKDITPEMTRNFAAIGKILLENGADPLLKDCQDWNALIYAIRSKNYLMVVSIIVSFSKYPIDLQRDILCHQTEQCPPALIMAVFSGDIKTIKLIAEVCKKVGADLNVADSYRQTALFYSIITDASPEITKYLLDQKTLVNTKNFTGMTPLLAAVHRRNLEKIKLLCEHNADVNESCTSNTTPLFFAISQNNIPILRYLLENTQAKIQDTFYKVWNKACFDFVKKEFMPPTSKEITDDEARVFINSNHQITKIVIERGLLETLEYFPLSDAIQNGSLECVILLLKASKKTSKEQQANFLQRGRKYPPIIEAAYYGRLSILLKLLHEGASHEITANDNTNIFMTFPNGASSVSKPELFLYMKTIFTLLSSSKTVTHKLLREEDHKHRDAITHAIEKRSLRIILCYLTFDPSILGTKHLIKFLCSTNKALFKNDSVLYMAILGLLLDAKISNALSLPYVTVMNDKTMIRFNKFLINSHQTLSIDESGVLTFEMAILNRSILVKISDTDLPEIISTLKKLREVNSDGLITDRMMQKTLSNYAPELKHDKEVLSPKSALKRKNDNLIIEFMTEFRAAKELSIKSVAEFTKLINDIQKNIDLSEDYLSSGVYFAKGTEKHLKEKYFLENESFKQELQKLKTKIAVGLPEINTDLQKLEQEVSSASLIENLEEQLLSYHKQLFDHVTEIKNNKNVLQDLNQKIEQQLEFQEKHYRETKTNDKKLDKSGKIFDPKQKEHRKNKNRGKRKKEEAIAAPKSEPKRETKKELNEKSLVEPEKEIFPSLPSKTLDQGAEFVSFLDRIAEIETEAAFYKPTPVTKALVQVQAQSQDQIQFQVQEQFLQKLKLDAREHRFRSLAPTPLTLDVITNASSNASVMDQRINVKEILSLKTDNDNIAFLQGLALSAAAGQLLENLKELTNGLLTPSIARHIRNVIFHGNEKLDPKALGEMLTKLLEAQNGRKFSSKTNTSLINLLNEIDPPKPSETLGFLAKLATTEIEDSKETPEFFEAQLLNAMKQLDKCRSVYQTEKHVSLRVMRMAVAAIFAELGTALSRLQFGFKEPALKKSETQEKLNHEARMILSRFKKSCAALLQQVSLKEIRLIGNKVRHANMIKTKYGRTYANETWQESIDLFLVKHFMPVSTVIPIKPALQTESGILSASRNFINAFRLNPNAPVFEPRSNTQHDDPDSDSARDIKTRKFT